MSKVLVVGRATIDFNPLDINMPLNESTTFKKYVGGSACNTAIGLQRQGIDTTILTKLSTDQFGKYISDYLVKEGIDTSLIKYDSTAKTGLTFTEILTPTESSILMYRDSVADLNLDILEVQNVCSGFDYVLLSGTTLAGQKSRTAILSIVNDCLDAKIPIIFDIDYRPYSWENPQVIDLYYSIVAKAASIIVGSLEEYRLMSSITKELTDDQIASYFLNKKAEHIVIKNGAEGSKYYTSNQSYKVNVYPIKLLKSFGGGDAYISTLITGLINDNNIEEVLLKSTAHAAMLVSSHSCSEALATNQEIEEFIRESDKKSDEIVKRRSCT